jgi:peptidoglycan/xylan/chitin deacetylase (PgdA/CDA1 family)
MNPGRPWTPVPVLGYHSIGDEPRDGTLRWSVSPGDFDEHMALLKERGCTAMTVSGYAATLRGLAPLPPRPVLITFDDGFADLVSAALPVLRRYGFTATAYVITSRVGAPRTAGTDPTLDWADMAELRAGGVEIGSHGHTHRALDCLHRHEVHRELALSKLVLEDKLREQVLSFAYPYGYGTRAVRREVCAAGYTSACGVKNALSHERDEIFDIARVLMQRDTGATGLDALLEGRGWPLAWRGERLRTRGWRAYRRTRHVIDMMRNHSRPAADTAAGRTR